MKSGLDCCLYARRSIRKFTQEPVDRAIIQSLLERAVLAPSASNLQPWKFVVVDDPVLVHKICTCSPGLGGKPPCILTFCLDAGLLYTSESGIPEKSSSVLDLAMAAENLMLAATGRGLGTCVVKSFHPRLVRQILRLPEKIYPEFLVTLGYPDQTPAMPCRRALEELTVYNTWSERADGTGV